MQHNPWNPPEWAATEMELSDARLPFVSIGVLNFNRREDLGRTLDVLTHAVQYPSYEIIVIDNGSTDGSVEMIKAQYPNVVLYEVGENIGTSARNHQTRLAKGKYLFSYDDDSQPGTPATIFRIVKFMESHNECDVLNAMCYQPRSGIEETAGWEAFRYGGNCQDGAEGIYLVEGGVCFRVETLRSVVGYEPRFVYASDGPDLALQLYKKDAKILLCPWFLTLHFRSSVARESQRAPFWRARHTVWMIAKHWGFLFSIVLIALYILRRIVGMILHRNTALEQAKGLAASMLALPGFLAARPKLSFRQTLNLKRFYLQLFRW